MYFLRGNVWEAPPWAAHKTEQVVAWCQIRQAAVAFTSLVSNDLYTQSYQQRRWDRFLARERHFFPKEHRLALGLSQIIYWVHRSYAPAVKRPGRRADHSCNAEIKNWSYTSTSTQPYLNGVVRNQTQELDGNRPNADWTTEFRKSPSCAY